MSPSSSESVPGLDVTTALLDDLETGGALVQDEGSFSIDASQALAKLREFQLADPHAYVLLLVEAAVLAGVEAVDVQITSVEILVGLGPLRLGRDDLEQLFATVFMSAEGLEPGPRRRLRALHKLALACNAALRLDLDAVEIEMPASDSPTDGGGWRLTLSPSDPRGRVDARDRVAQARVRVRTANLAEVVGDGYVARLLRERCAFSSVPIMLDGERISASLERALHTSLSRDELALKVRARKLRPLLLDGATVGYAALRYGGGLAPLLRLSTNGVLSETIALDAFDRYAALDFLAVVDLDLPKDLGQTKIMRGPIFDAMMAEVWATHDEIAPPKAGEGATAAREPVRATSFDWSTRGQALGPPIGTGLLGLLILWASYDDGGVSGLVLVAFSLVLIVGSFVALVHALRSA